MRNIIVYIVLVVNLLLLAACGGSPTAEPVADSPPAAQEEQEVVAEPAEVEEAATEEPAAEEEMAEEEVMEEEAPADEASAEEPAGDEASAEEPAAEEGAVGFGDMQMSGTDPDTGLEINPDTVQPGDTFIARGIVISMNLTPITEPEFLIQAPSGSKYRIRTQPLTDIYFIDGSQWQAFEFRQGVGAIATITLDASASASDVATSDDVVLVMME